MTKHFSASMAKGDSCENIFMVAWSKKESTKEIHFVPRQIFITERGKGMVQEVHGEKRRGILMPRYIDAEKLEKDGWSASRTYPQDAKTMVYETKKLTDFPTADVVEVKHGKWIKTEGRFSWHCSLCKVDDQFAYCWNREKGDYDFQDNYCPSCGARMDGE